MSLPTGAGIRVNRPENPENLPADRKSIPPSGILLPTLPVIAPIPAYD
jgi:hypothetical protein